MTSDTEDSAGSFGDIAVERRRSHRETIVAIGKVVSLGDEHRGMQVLITDLSLHGCDFRCITPPQDDRLYRIEISVGPLSLASRIRIIRSHIRSDSTFEIGAEFV